MRKLTITVLMDIACIPSESPGDKTTEHTTEYHVVTALKELGHRVHILGVGDRVEPIIAGLTENRPDLVFNLTEQFRNDRRMDKHIAGLLELLKIPFTGTGFSGLMLCRNKGLCKQLLKARKIHVPRFVILFPKKSFRVPGTLHFPLVVKPLYEDGSEGISNASLVKDCDELRERATLVFERWNQPVIAEEYINGRELYVGVLGNRRQKVLPPRELFFGNAETGGPVLATYRVKWNEDYQKKWNIKFGNAALGDPAKELIARSCKKAYHILQVLDYGRIDIRLTPDNKVYILEVNPNPDIAYGEEVAEAAEKAGICYNNLIDGIIRSAMKRYDLPSR
ncbi:MAG: ATP-grasp domain-containing protein [Chitinivibrionales bacterium]|nr:ATP-grasp domain-containing protein [Chitinivibrionales bacterium]